jgi:tRNA uracil 4-sulfurtransferase
MNFQFIICHYSEIALKGKNRKLFEDKLVENIKKAVSPSFFKKIKRIEGRVLIELKDKYKEEEITESLKNVFGLSSFSFAFLTQQNIEDMQNKILETIKKEKPKSFKIFAKRSKKDFYLTSPEINEKIGEYVLKNFKKIKVDLENPDLICFVEIVQNYAFIYFKKIKALGGLPVGISGKAVSLISGGIDSPVASFLAQKRGIEIIFVHFHAYPFAGKASLEKVKKIIKVLNKYQFSSKLYLVPFADIQKEILLKTKASLRVLFYRRFMFMISQTLAEKEKAKVLITGENIGQVASQTLENISVIEEAISLPVLRPLICYDKEEIINKAKEIKTFEISILPHQDCCARFLPPNPETKASLKEIKAEEEKINSKKIIKEAILKTKLEVI